jgi:hypothetical protein
LVLLLLSDDLADPVKKQGWLTKLGDGLFAQWKKRFGYTLPPPPLLPTVI